MGEIKESRLLATYITYKELYGTAEKDTYDVIAEFIKYAILQDRKAYYNQMELSQLLKNQFGFSIPDLVIKPSVKRLKGTMVENQKFYIDYSQFGESDNFSSLQQQSLQHTNIILEKLCEYISVKRNKEVDSLEAEHICRAFLKYILDEVTDIDFNEWISAFIIENQEDESFINQINQIRAGHILYMGVNYNDNISEIGSWKTELTIYLDMEILFHLVGYNGVVFQKLTTDFLALVDRANSVRKLIKLRYFQETKREIEKFFDKAEYVVKDRQILNPGLPAMGIITKSCQNVSDVIDKKSDFYLKLNRMSIPTR